MGGLRKPLACATYSTYTLHMVMITASVRLDGEIAERLDRIAQKSSERAGGAEITRSNAIRMALERGIAELEKELKIKREPKPRSRD